MSERPQVIQDSQAQPGLLPATVGDIESGQHADMAIQSPEVETDWYAQIEKDVREGDYVDRLYRPSAGEIGSLRRGETQEEWEKRAADKRQWWQKERAGVLRRELDFFDKVYIGIMEMADGHSDPVRALFDGDQTIVDTVTDDEGVDRLIVRPAFIRVVEALREKLGDRLQIGLLTSLNVEKTREDVLAGSVKPEVIAEELLIGTRQYAQTRPDLALYPLEQGVSNETVLQGLRSLLRPDFTLP